jgi:hypothetical protein
MRAKPCSSTPQARNLSVTCPTTGRHGPYSRALLGDVGEEAMNRLRVFLDTEDGFEIAREDLRLRGMGDLFDPDLKKPVHKSMQQMLRRGYGRALELFCVG